MNIKFHFILLDVLHVLNREARARKFSFQILATGCKYHLAAESAEDRERWVKGLKQLLFGPPQHGIVCEFLCICHFMRKQQTLNECV